MQESREGSRPMQESREGSGPRQESRGSSRPRLKRRKVISALTRKTSSMSKTRPSTACAHMSLRPVSRETKIRNFKHTNIISEKVRLKSWKRRPKTGVSL